LIRLALEATLPQC